MLMEITLPTDLTMADAERVAIRTVRAALGKRPRETGLAYVHVRSTEEPILWISDAVAWCHGAGEPYRSRILPVLDAVVNLDMSVP